MIKIEASTLEEAYKNAAESLECSITELKIEVTQVPRSGFCGFFKKSAIIVAIKEVNTSTPNKSSKITDQDKREALNQEVANDTKQTITQEKPKPILQETSKKENKKQNKKAEQKRENKKKTGKEIAKEKRKKKEKKTIAAPRIDHGHVVPKIPAFIQRTTLVDQFP